MSRRPLPLMLLASAVALPFAAASAQHSPYAGEQGRDIKALSAREMADLLAGRGMGMARAAELNGHPGPMHVLDLRDRLGLTPEQEAAVRASFARMEAAAKPLGAELVEQERALDRTFAGGTITTEAVRSMAAGVGDVQGRLRAAHLAAHVETRAVLTDGQVRAYDALRGYSRAEGTPEPHGAAHGHRRGRSRVGREAAQARGGEVSGDAAHPGVSPPVHPRRAPGAGRPRSAASPPA